MRAVAPARVWPVALSLLGAVTGCSLEEVPLVGDAPTGEVPRDAGADAGDAGPGPDAAVDVDAGEGCTYELAAPAEVTLGTRVHVTSDLSCVEPPGTHTCSWRARWSDDGDDVDTISSGEHPCVTGEAFQFTAAASSNDGSSVYWVSLELDGVQTATIVHVFVSEIRAVATGKKGPGKVADIATDPVARRAWLASEIGIAAMLGFEDENVPLLPPPSDRCEDTVAACVLHTVAVAAGFAFAGVDGDEPAIVRAEVSDGAIVAEEIALPTPKKIRSIVASTAPGGADDPGLYVSSPDLTWVLARRDLDDPLAELAIELATGGADLDAIVATAVETDAGGGSEALWRLETGGSGELQRLASIGAGRPSLAPEDILNKSGACAAVYDGMLVVGQKDGRAFALDLAAIDPGAATPLADAAHLLEVPIADDPNGALDTLDRVIDLFVSEDGATLWAVSPTTLYRLTEGILFRSRTVDVPKAMLSVAALQDEGGAEVILIGTDDGVWMTRPDLHPR